MIGAGNDDASESLLVSPILADYLGAEGSGTRGGSRSRPRTSGAAAAAAFSISAFPPLALAAGPSPPRLDTSLCPSLGLGSLGSDEGDGGSGGGVNAVARSIAPPPAAQGNEENDHDHGHCRQDQYQDQDQDRSSPTPTEMISVYNAGSTNGNASISGSDSAQEGRGGQLRPLARTEGRPELESPPSATEVDKAAENSDGGDHEISYLGRSFSEINAADGAPPLFQNGASSDTEEATAASDLPRPERSSTESPESPERIAPFQLKASLSPIFARESTESTALITCRSQATEISLGRTVEAGGGINVESGGAIELEAARSPPPNHGTSSGGRRRQSSTVYGGNCSSLQEDSNRGKATCTTCDGTLPSLENNANTVVKASQGSTAQENSGSSPDPSDEEEQGPSSSPVDQLTETKENDKEASEEISKKEKSEDVENLIDDASSSPVSLMENRNHFSKENSSRSPFQPVVSIKLQEIQQNNSKGYDGSVDFDDLVRVQHLSTSPHHSPSPSNKSSDQEVTRPSLDLFKHNPSSPFRAIEDHSTKGDEVDRELVIDAKETSSTIDGAYEFDAFQSNDLSSAKKKLGASSHALVKRLRGAAQKRTRLVSKSRDSLIAKEHKQKISVINSWKAESHESEEESAGDSPHIVRPQPQRRQCEGADQQKVFKARPLPATTGDLGSGGQVGIPKVAKRPPTIPKSPLLGVRRQGEGHIIPESRLYQKVREDYSKQRLHPTTSQDYVGLESPMTTNANPRFVPFKARPLPSTTGDLGHGGQTGVPKIAKRKTTVPESPLLGYRRRGGHLVGALCAKEIVNDDESGRQNFEAPQKSEFRARPFPVNNTTSSCSLSKSDPSPELAGIGVLDTRHKRSQAAAYSFFDGEENSAPTNARPASADSPPKKQRTNSSFPDQLHSTRRARERAQYEQIRCSRNEERKQHEMQERKQQIREVRKELNDLRDALR